MPADPTGDRHVLRSSRAEAEIAQVGAALRALRIDGVALVPEYADDTPTPAAAGITLVPWPNRVRDGRWYQRGTDHQLAISEPKFGNASHGLLRFAPYTLAEASTDAVTLAASVVPQTGYPFHLATTVTYRLTDDGLGARHTITNVGADDAPVALGTHPYLQIGDVDTADLRVEVDAAEWTRLDERNLPIAEEPVDADHDLRTPRRLGDVSLDTALTGLARDPEGRVRGILHAPDGRRLELWGDEHIAYLQVFTTDRFPGQELAVAIEPMTAPADALNSGSHLRWLAPGETWSVEWGIDYHR